MSTKPGVGPLAGPVVAAAVILPAGTAIAGLGDSKAIAARRREALYDEILASAVVGVAASSPSEIDRENIHRATLLAMTKAVRNLATAPDMALIDGKFVPPDLPCPGRAIVKGDALEAAIGAASIVAKVVRDRAMIALDDTCPGYGFARHKGYPTAAHLSALDRLGPSPHHRLSFAPVRLVLDRRARSAGPLPEPSV